MGAIPAQTSVTAADPVRAFAQKARHRALVVPREHGAWGMLLIPLATGALVGLLEGGRSSSVLTLAVAALALFWLRTPLESLYGAGGIHVQSRDEKRLVSSVLWPLAGLTVVSLTALFWQGQNLQLFWIGAIAGIAFLAQTLLKRIGRNTRMAAELCGALVLTSTAPAAYSAAVGRLSATAWCLWLVNWLFAVGQIHFVWLRIRGTHAGSLKEKIGIGWTFFAGNIFLGVVLASLYHFAWLPKLALLAFLPILFRGFAWFAKKPGPLVIRRLGWGEMLHALAFAVLLVVGFGFSR